ncbi:MAG: antitoxin VapB family protein [Thermoplasmata archaeon]
MDTTTIALDREAYELLRNAKLPGESFSKTVKRLARTRTPLSHFAGSWSELDPADVEAMRSSVLAGRRVARKKSNRVQKGWT